MPVQDPKGKSIAQEQKEVSSIEVLFGLLGSTLCERSNSHLLLVLLLLDIILTAAKDKAPKPAQQPAAPRELPAVPENEESGQPASTPAAAAQQPPEPAAELQGAISILLHTYCCLDAAILPLLTSGRDRYSS